MTDQVIPVLTVVVPSYNVEQYLKKNLNSFADNRFDDRLEVLIVNDGSTDSTEAIALEYVKSFPNIFHLINKGNGGHGSTINAGIDAARGTYFRIVDGDDWVNTDNFAQLLTILEKTTSDLVVDEKREVDMITKESVFFPFPDYVNPSLEQEFERVCNIEDTESYISIHTLIVKTSILRTHNICILEGIFYVDYEFIVKATCYAKTITFVPLEIYQYLVGNSAQSVAVQNYVKRYDQHEKIVRELLEFYSAQTFDKPIEEYLFDKIKLLIHTHYNILLIFDIDRSRGRRRAEKFNEWLTDTYPNFAESTEKRYRQARMMGRVGFDKDRLDRFMGRG